MVIQAANLLGSCPGSCARILAGACADCVAAAGGSDGPVVAVRGMDTCLWIGRGGRAPDTPQSSRAEIVEIGAEGICLHAIVGVEQGWAAGRAAEADTVLATAVCEAGRGVCKVTGGSTCAGAAKNVGAWVHWVVSTCGCGNVAVTGTV